MMHSTSVLTTGQVAKLCNVAPRTVAKWVDSGRLGGYKLPGSLDRRIPYQELVKFLEAHRMTQHVDSLRTSLVRNVIVIGPEDPSIREALQGVRSIELSWFSNLFDGAQAIDTSPLTIILMIQGMDEIAAATLIRQKFGFTIPVIGVVERDELVGKFRALGFTQVKLHTSKHIAQDLAKTVTAYAAN